jgi:ABC-type uncharacterized transport system auxiliary subunit
MRIPLMLLVVFLLAACAGPGVRQTDHYFVLEAGPAREPLANRTGEVGAMQTKAAVDAQKQRGVAVRVLPSTVSAFYDTQDIVFSRAAGTRGYYQFNHWTERPHQAFHAQLAARFAYPAANAGYLLATHVDEIYHDAVAAPGTARVVITAELIDGRSRHVIAGRTIITTAPATTFDAAGAVHGFNDAVEHALNEIVQWVDSETASMRSAVAEGS